MSTRLLSAEDIYDLYGCESILDKVDAEDESIVTYRLGEIRDVYLAAGKSRIRAEAKFLGIKLDGDGFNFSQVIDQIKKNIAASMESQAEHMMRGGSFNLMGTILKAHQAAGADMKGIDLGRYGVTEAAQKPVPKNVDPEWFMNTKSQGGRVWDDPRWAEIAKAYVAIEEARTNSQIVMTIDRLNQLQHNSFHVLIDLQTGRMLTDYTNQTEDREARKRLQEVLNIKMTSTTVDSFKDKMSPDVRKLITKYRRG